MNQPTQPRRINVAALLVAAAGILVIFASAPALFPPVPPGPIILAVAAGLVAFAPGRWTPIIGVVVPLFIFVGGFVSGGLADALNENTGAVVGTVIQVLALITAIVAGALTTTGGRHRTGSQGGS